MSQLDLTPKEIRQKIESEDDFVCLPKFNNSLSEVLEHYPDGVPTKIIARALMMSEQDIDKIFKRAINKLRESLKVETSDQKV